MLLRKSGPGVLAWLVIGGCGGDDGVGAGGTTAGGNTTDAAATSSGPTTVPGTTDASETTPATSDPGDTSSPTGGTTSGSSEGSTGTADSTESTSSDTGSTSSDTGSTSSDTESTSSSTGSTSSSTGSGTTEAIGECPDDTTGGDVGVPVLPDDCAGDVLGGDVFLPGEVYLAGTLGEGACFLDAIAHWSTPNDAVAGFVCDFDNRAAIIRPADGRLVYTHLGEGTLYEFHCDTCPIAPGDDYPLTPLDNDIVLDTPACDPDDSFLDFLVAPEGWHVYRCHQSFTTWYDDEGNVFYDDDEELLHVGYSYALTESSVLRLCDGEMIPIDGLPDETPMTIRANADDGFLVVMAPEQPELWHVSTTGAATSMGVYPELPVGYDDSPLGDALDACGALYQLGDGPMAFEDVILRRELSGTTDVVYTELDDPFVAIHISDLVTGS